MEKNMNYRDRNINDKKASSEHRKFATDHEATGKMRSRKKAGVLSVFMALMIVMSGMSVVFADSTSMAEDSFDDKVNTRVGSYNVSGVHQSTSTTSVTTFGSAMPLSTIYIDMTAMNNPASAIFNKLADSSNPLQASFADGIKVVNGIASYDPTGQALQLKAEKDNYLPGNLFSYTFRDAATLPDGTPANVRFTYSNAHIFVDQRLGSTGAGEPLNGAVNLAQGNNVKYRNNSYTNYGRYYDAVTGSTDNPARISFQDSNRFYYPINGLSMDARVQIVDDAGNPIAGTFIFPAVGLNIDRDPTNPANVSKMLWYFDDDYPEMDFFSEALRVNSGNVSDIYVRPNTDQTEANAYGNTDLGYFNPRITEVVSGAYQGAVKVTADTVSGNVMPQASNGHYSSGFITTADSAAGFNVTATGHGGYNSGMDTYLIRGNSIWHRIRSVTGSGGTIQTTSEGNNGGTLDDKSDSGEDAAVLGPGTYVVPDGKKVTYTMTPMPGYTLDKLYVNDDLTVFPNEITGVADMADGATMRHTLADGSICTITKSSDGKGVYTFDFPSNKSNHTILVTWKPSQAEAKATKIWYDKNDAFGTRDDVTVHLVASVENSDGGSSSYPVDFLPAYKILEQSVADGNEAGSFTFGEAVAYTGTKGETVYAKVEDVPTTQDSAGKTLYYFYDFATHKFTAYTYNTITGEYVLDTSDTDGDGNGKTDYWVNFLPKYDEAGNQIIYTIDEDVPDGYSLTTVTKDYGSLATYPGLTTAKFDYALKNTLEPVGTVKVKATKALEGRPFNSTDEFVFVLSGKDSSPMPVGSPAKIPADGEDTPKEVAKTITPLANTVLADVDFGIISYRKSDLTETKITYGTPTPEQTSAGYKAANDEQKDAVRFWTVKDAPTEVDKRDSRGYAEYVSGGDTFYYDEANQKLYDSTGTEFTGFDINNYTKQTATITADRVYDMLDTSDAAEFGALGANLQNSATATSYEKKFEYVVTENPKHPDYVENDPETHNMTVRVFYNEKENKIYIDDEEDTTTKRGVTNITAETTTALTTPSYTLHRDFFTNTYDNKVSWDPEITKILNGRPISKDQFKDYFTIKAVDTTESINVQVEGKVADSETPMPGDANATTGLYPHGGTATSNTQEIESATSAPKGTSNLKGIVGFDTITYTNDDLLKEIYYDGATDDQKNRVIKWVNGGKVYGPIPGSATASVTLANGTMGIVTYDNATDAQRAEVKSRGDGWTGTDGTYYDITEATHADLTGSKGYYYLDSRKFTYKIWESGTAKDGYTNDTAHDSESKAYEVEVIVTRDNTTGKLSVTADKKVEDLLFENKYKAEGDALIKVTKKMDGRDEFGRKTFPSESEVKFTISKVTADAPLPSDGDNSNDTTVRLPAGESSYTLTDTQAFNIKFETKHLMDANQENYVATRNKDGLYERTFVYKITEIVTAGQGTAAESATEGLQPGTDPKDSSDTRHFVLVAVTVQEDNEGNIKVVAINGADQTALDKSEYSNQNIAIEGYYPESGKGTWDGASGKMDSVVTSKVKAGTIYNTYQASGDIALSVKKKLEGRTTLANNMFYFELRNAKDNSVVDEKPNTGANVNFDTIVYNLNQVRADVKNGLCTDESGSGEGPWIYEYKVKELIPAGNAKSDKITQYDTTEHTIKVKITDKGDGTLTTEITEGDDIEFVNKSELIDIKVDKVWEDAALKALADAGYDRPVSIGVILKADGTEVDRATLSGTGDTWTYTFKDLPKYQAGATTGIAYTVEEIAPEGYTVTYAPAGGAINGGTDATDGTATVTITNKPNAQDILGADLVVHKIDSVTKKGISGVKFTLTGPGNLSEDYTTDAYGVIHINLEELATAGADISDTTKLSLQETSTPTGYEANTDIYELSVKDSAVDHVDLKASGKNVFNKIWDFIVSNPESATYADGILTVKNTPKTNTVTITKTFKDENGTALPANALPSGFTVYADYTKSDGTKDTKDLKIGGSSGASYNTATGTATWTVRNVPYGTEVHVHEAAYTNITGYDFKSVATTCSVTGAKIHEDDANFTMPEAAATVTFANTYERQKGDLKLTKVWDDASNQDGKRPTNVNFTVTASAEPVKDAENSDWTKSGSSYTKTVTLSGTGDTWTDSSLTGLYVKDTTGTDITYTVSEPTAPNDYTKSPATDVSATLTANTVTEADAITNKYTPKTATLTVTKTWDDNNNKAGLRKATNVYLYADDKLVGGQGEGEKQISTANDASVSWNNLPIYKNENGTSTKIKYRVVEEAVPGYAAPVYSKQNVELDETNGGAIAITNKYEPTFKGLTIKKKWDDNSNQDGYRARSLTVTVQATYADGSGNAPVFDGDESTLEVTLTGTGNEWSETILSSDKDLPSVHNGKQVIYYVSGEEFVGGDETKYSHSCIERSGAGEFTITNIHEPEVGCIEVQKIWDDNNNQDGLRSDVTMTLKADGEEAKYADGTAVAAKPISGNANTPQEAEWHNLPVYKDGAKISYTVEESGANKAYTTTYSDPVRLADDNDVKTITVTNAHNPETTSLTATKVWQDANNREGLRTDVILHLKGTIAGADFVSMNFDDKTIAVNESAADGASAGMATWTNLPTHHDGKEITYAVTEEAVDGYTTAVSGTAENGFTVTNTLIPVVENVSVTKVWDDADNHDGKRTDVSVTLLANGTAARVDQDGAALTNPLTLATGSNHDQNMTGTWENLPAYDSNGNRIIYRVQEAEITDYTTQISSDSYDWDTKTHSFTITNSHAMETKVIKLEKQWYDDYGNAFNTRPDALEIELLGWDDILGGQNPSVRLTEDAYGHPIKTHLSAADTDPNDPNKWTYTVTVPKYYDGSVSPHPFAEMYYFWRETIPTGHFAEAEGGEGAFAPGIYPDDAPYPVRVSKTMMEYDKDGTTLLPNAPVLGTLTITKTWDDANNAYRLRPTAEEYADMLTLFAGNTKVTVVKPTVVAGTGADANKYTVTYEFMPVFDKNGKKIEYSLEEDVPAGYTLSSGPTPAKVTFTMGSPAAYDDHCAGTAEMALTNKHVPGTTTATVTKVWNDANNREGKRPEADEFLGYLTLKRAIGGGTPEEVTDVTPTIVLKKNNRYEVSWSKLPEFDTEGNKYSYSITETLPDDSYYAIDGEATVASGGTITNTVKQDNVRIKVTKKWVGEATDNVTVKLKSDAASGDGVVATHEFKKSDFDAADTAEFTFEKTGADNAGQDKLPKYNLDPESDNFCKEIVYTVEETPDGTASDAKFSSEITGDAENGFVITNTNGEKITIYATKVWNDPGYLTEDQKKELHTDVILHLYGYVDGEVVYYAGSKKVEMGADGKPKSSVTWADVPKRYYSDKNLKWKLVEDAVFGYVASIEGDADSGFTVTNTYAGAEAEIKVSKAWEDNNYSGRPAKITYILKQKILDGDQNPVSEYDRQTVNVGSTSEGKAEYTWKNLPVVKEIETDEDAPDTTRIEYEEKEQQVSNDAGWLAYKRLTDPENPEDPAKDEIIYVNPEDKDTYDADTTNYAPEMEKVSIPVEQTEDGGKVTKEVPVLYSVEEVYDDADDALNLEKLGYEEPVVEAVAPGEFKVTNIRRTEMVNFEIRKIWNDEDDAEGLRPDHITLRLMNGDEEVRKATLTEDDDWMHTFMNLPKTGADGAEIKYSIEEVSVPGYTSKVPDTLSSTEVNEIINTHNVGGLISLEATKKWVEEDGYKSQRSDVTFKLVKIYEDAEGGARQVVAGSEKTVATGSKHESNMTATWTGLPTIENGKKLFYTVVEDKVDGYESTYSDVTKKSGSDSVYTVTVTNTSTVKEEVEPPKPTPTPVPDATGDVIYIDPRNSKGNMIVGSTKYDTYSLAEQAANAMANQPADPEHSGVKFIGWDLNVDKNGNYVLVAMYSEIPDEVSPVVSYIDPQSGAPVLVSEFAGSPKDVIPPEDPSHENMQFVGWEETKDVAGNTIFVAKYKCDCRNGSPGTPKDVDKSKVDTGDDAMITVWQLLFLMAISFLILTMMIRKRAMETNVNDSYKSKH